MRSDQQLGYALRPSSASPAVGYLQLHAEQQRDRERHRELELAPLAMRHLRDRHVVRRH